VIEYGLSEAAALRAITATPAELFGIARGTRIEAGLPATFVVTDGPLFGKETRIVYTFVEGALEPGREARKPAANDSESDAVEINLTGTWSAEISADIGSTTGSMTLKQTGGSFTGSIADTEVGVMTIQKGNITGNQIDFQLIVQFGDDLIEIQFRGSVEGDTMTAKGSSTMGQVSLHARRSGGFGGAR
jgi:adenine deaminase